MSTTTGPFSDFNADPTEVRLYLGRFNRAPQTLTQAEATAQPGGTTEGGAPDPEERAAAEGEAPQASDRGGLGEDFRLQFDADGLVRLMPLTGEAEVWVDAHIDPLAEWVDGSLLIEPEYLTDIIAAIEMHGLTVRSSRG